jgi:hypothetical protein
MRELAKEQFRITEQFIHSKSSQVARHRKSTRTIRWWFSCKASNAFRIYSAAALSRKIAINLSGPGNDSGATDVRSGW